MEVFREIRQTDSDKLVIDVPEEFRDRKVEITIVPVNKKKNKKFSKEIENFLKLGGSGCWEGNLDEMRESRDGVG
ncbi:MAG: hypothetical protein PVH61_19175 [Candidatus Aminicenantes bacterium]|jgi:hypothetical protein